MLNSRSNKIAATAFISTLIRVLSAPLILIALSHELSNEELSIYFVFFSLAAVRQLLEAGIGGVLKQKLAIYFLSSDRICNKVKLKSYVNFSFLYFFLLGVTVFLLMSVFGTFFISEKKLDVDWLLPWFLFSLMTFVSTALVPIIIVLDSFQMQMKLQKYQLLSSLTYTISLLCFTYLGYGLTSISIALLLSNSLLYSCSLSSLGDDFLTLLSFSNARKNFNRCFLDIKSFLSKTSLSFLSTFSFWNVIPLICFYFTPAYYSSSFNLTWALLKSGFYMAQMINVSQLTIYTKLSAHPLNCYSRFYKVFTFCMLMLIFGYASFFVVKAFDFQIFKETLEGITLIILIATCILFSPFVLISDFSRCFSEDFYSFNVFMVAISTFVFFLLSFITSNHIFYYGNILVLIISNIFLYIKFMKIKFSMVER
jgi:hypothetical protein